MPDKPGSKPLVRVVDELDLAALQTLLWNATGHAECPRCGFGDWKPSAYPTCVRCGWRPTEKGAYLAMVRQCLGRLQAELAPDALRVRPLVRAAPPLEQAPTAPDAVEVELRVGCVLAARPSPAGLRAAASAMMGGLAQLITQKFTEQFPEVMAAMQQEAAEKPTPSDEAGHGDAPA